MRKTDKIYIAGHTGLVGSALVRRLEKDGYTNLITKTHSELDLNDEKAVKDFFEGEKPDYVFLAAGKVGGIVANDTHPAGFIYENLKIQTNVIHSSWETKVKKLLYLGCSCLYPRNCSQPMREEYLLTGPFEPTNEAYSVAKLAGLKMCQAYNHQYKTSFICCIAENLYGPNDKLDLENSHVIPAMIMKFHSAKVKKEPNVVIWGSGKPRRGFLYVDDLVGACLFLMKNYNSSEIINVGSGVDISIRELAEIIKEIVGFTGEIKFDTTKPNGMPKKLLDSSKISFLGWRSKTSLKEGLEKTYRWWLETKKS